LSSIREEYPLVNRGQTTEAMDLPRMDYHYVPTYDHHRPRTNSKNKFLDNLLKRSTSRGSRNSIRSPSASATVADVDHPNPGGKKHLLLLAEQINDLTLDAAPDCAEQTTSSADIFSKTKVWMGKYLKKGCSY
jgi:hypothetical protein